MQDFSLRDESRSLPRPKLVFFQYKCDERLPEFLLIHKREHVKCLSQFFEVIVVTGDCDYRQICDRYQPDVALFESGVKDYPSHQRPRMVNVNAHPQIPKLGLHRQDSFCRARAGFLSDMDHWGITTFFAIATTTPEHMPDIADNLFVWPNFVDTTIYRDYGESKSIPVLFVGNTSTLYPWRKKVTKLVTRYYPSMLCPHPGYDPGSPVPQIMLGERYARTINASFVAPACGTVVKEVVRKHLEIPACNTCLVTERSPALESAGFIDMVNCVFADENDVLDKLAFLFGHPEELRRITKAGHDLVHSCHTIANRDQIFRWYSLYKSRGPDQKIVQLGPFGPLTLVQTLSRVSSRHIVAQGEDLALLREGDEKLWDGKFAEAEKCYLKCLHYLPWMPEPKLKLALLSLYTGNAKAALSWLEEPLSFILCEYKAVDPDPVEWAYFIVSLLCQGNTDDAVKHSGEFPWLHHPDLDYARWAAGVLNNGSPCEPKISNDCCNLRCSVHRMPARSLNDWAEELCLMLKACQQHVKAEILTRSLYSADTFLKSRDDPGRTRTSARGQLPRIPGGVSTNARTVFTSSILRRRLHSRIRKRVAKVLHHLESRCGYFLPYRYSVARMDEFYQSVHELARTADIETALIIGAACGQRCTEALLAGIGENMNQPSVFCIVGSKDQCPSTQAMPTTPRVVKWYSPPSCPPEELPKALGGMLEEIRKENEITSFDLLLISDCTSFTTPGVIADVVNKQLHSAKFILLNNIITADSYRICTSLFGDRRYQLMDHNSNLRNGYVIFERTDCCGGVSW